MKKLLVILLLIFEFCCSVPAFAQSFPPTGTLTTCSNCVPSAAYSIVSGTPSVSDREFYGASSSKWRIHPANGNNIIVAPAPPSSSYPNSINQGSNTFLTLMKGPNLDSKVKFAVSGFIPGQKYKLNYAVMASRTLGTGFGTQAILEVQPSNSQVNLATLVTDLAQSQYIWTDQQIQFTPTTTETVFVLSGNAVAGEVGLINFDIYARPLECILPVNKQVGLTHGGVKEIMYPCQTLNLNSLVTLPLPVGAEVVWSYSSVINNAQDHLAKQVVESAKINPATGKQEYFAFYYHAANVCYSLQQVASTAKVELTYVPKQVPLTIGAYALVKCPDTEYALGNKLANPIDGNNQVRWFNNNKHQGAPIASGTVTSPGTYYAFYYNQSLDCYSVETSTSSVTVFFQTPCCKAGATQVAVQPTTISNVCPNSTADLTTTTLNANVPLNTQIVWFNNSTHTPPSISDPSAVGPGTYYAFIYDPGANCYNTDNSAAQVKVTTTLCASNVQLSLKAALQGAISGGSLKMKNDLQTYGGTGLLPTSSPYSVSSSYPSINNVAGIVGEVVDWVSIEVRSGSSPQTVLQTKSLLLKPNGSVVDRNGQTPTFNPEAGPVRLVVKHRNHLAVMSNLIQNFSAGSTISYDFTTALSQASNEAGDPPQMVQNNGIWCMWAGDVNDSQDLGIDATDSNEIYKTNNQDPSYDIYTATDINMDGGVDSNDRNLIYLNNLTGSISTLANY